MRFASIVAAAAASLAAGPSLAATLIGTLGPGECGGPGGFSNCYAYPDGTTSQGQNGGGSPAIFKYNSGGSTDISTQFPSIDGSEFSVNYTAVGNSLSFLYTPGAGDPVIHYYLIFQAGKGKLFYDADAITSGTVALSDYFSKNPGFSHITFFDTGGVINPLGGVPEPSIWMMMLLGFGAIGFAIRKQRQTVRFSFA